MSSAHSVSAPTQSGRRLHARRRMDGLVYVDLGPNNGALLIDLGEGGLSFQSVAPVSLDQAVLLKFKLPGDSSPIESYAEVAWLDESQKGGGLRFVELSTHALDQIRGWAGVPAAPETVAAVAANGAANSAQQNRKQSLSANSNAAEESIAPAPIETAAIEAAAMPAEVSETLTAGEKAQPLSPETHEAAHAAEAAGQEIPALVDPATKPSPLLEFIAEIEAAASLDAAAAQPEAPQNDAPPIAGTAENAATESSLPDDRHDDSINDPAEIAAPADAIRSSSGIPRMAAGLKAAALLDGESPITTDKPGASASDVSTLPARIARGPEPTPQSRNPVAVAPAKPAHSPASHSKTEAPVQKRPQTPASSKTESSTPPAYREDSPVRANFVRQTPRPAPATTDWESFAESEPESKAESNELQGALRGALRCQAVKIGMGAFAGACLVLALAAAVPSLKTRVQATANVHSAGLNSLKTPAFEVEVADLNNRRWILRSGGEAGSPFVDSPSRETRPGSSNSPRESAKASKSKESDRSADAAGAPGAANVENAEEVPQPKLPKPGVLALSRPLVKQSNTPSTQLLAPSIFDGITPPVGSFSDGLPASGPRAPGIVPPESPETVRTSALQAAVLLQRLSPVYPPAALSSGVHGDVTVNATIGKDGVPKNLKAVRGDARLIPAALAAISQWRYRPATLGGEPIETQINVTVSFQLQ